MASEKEISSQSTQITDVDLGDDLLEETVAKSSVNIEPGFSHELDIPDEIQPGAVGDLLQSARILMREGLTDDAKKILRQILVHDSRNAVARKILEEIQAVELKQIFGERRIRRSFARSQEPEWVEVDSLLVMRQLDQDLSLGIFSESRTSAYEEDSPTFTEPRLLEEFTRKVESSLSGAAVQDWIDLGIGFLEMDLYSVAVRLFAGARNRIETQFLDDSKKNDQRLMILSCTSLLAMSLILLGRPFEAISKIQSLLREIEIHKENQVELFYLMGRAYESMKKEEFAFEFYRQVVEIDPHYRDIDQRLRKQK